MRPSFFCPVPSRRSFSRDWRRSREKFHGIVEKIAYIPTGSRGVFSRDPVKFYGIPARGKMFTMTMRIPSALVYASDPLTIIPYGIRTSPPRTGPYGPVATAGYVFARTDSIRGPIDGPVRGGHRHVRAVVKYQTVPLLPVRDYYQAARMQCASKIQGASNATEMFLRILCALIAHFRYQAGSM
jgi:hypothetical protein